ncbi:fatty acid desaturase [Robiginitomaculum antarcticum]|uniref:fatty acid desaturase n=1 Tax=Robiginitomaculum antarcticum TaxID=437507 RepID=UPI0003701CC6|nr:fatty acid desaturase [Robiginitomaculum antarcticum]
MLPTARTWFQRLAPYRKPEDGRAVFELLITLIPFLALWAGIWALMTAGHYWAVIGFIPAGGLLVRLFIIQHDCGHQSMFAHRRVNDWIGRFIGILTLTPYDHWKRGHALHHAGSGNLDRRGIGDDIITMTVEEYKSASKWGRLKYRLYRHPVIMFGVGPAYVFFLQNRLPLGAMKDGAKPWASTLLTNLGVAVLYGALIWAVGWKIFVLIQIPTILVGASIGVWMFYVQHQFDETHWSRTGEWDRKYAALEGSSYYDLPAWLMWLTGNIGVHHVHHLSARIPFYQLPRILKAHPELKSVGRLTFLQSLKCVKLALWCESQKRMISFRMAKAQA